MAQYRTRSFSGFIVGLALYPFIAGAADEDYPAPLEGRFEMHGELQTAKLDETSGMVAGSNGLYYMHNDDGGAWIYAMGADGTYHGRFRVLDAKNKDWEDITRVPGPDGPLIVVADSGDNQAGRKDIELYFVPEPAADALRSDINRKHKVNVAYEDGPRDVEAVAYEPSSRLLMFLSKRDQPPRLYALPLDEALQEEDVIAKFVAEVPGFRPPTRADFLANPTRGLWVSQPTGLDFSPDGRWAAVMTYRSLYLFERATSENWEEAFQKPAIEYLGPPGFHEEAVAFDPEGRFIYVTTEKRPAPIHRIPVPDPAPQPSED